MDQRGGPASQWSGDNVGLLRLLFAILVILSHAFEIVDGNRSREPLSRLFGTLSSGELAVDGFFLLSGYLVTQSFAGSATTAAFIQRRLLRIVPGFWVCVSVCVLVVAPLAGRHQPGAPPFAVPPQLAASLWLAPPDVPGVFAGLSYPSLNGPLWTIAYDARCYALVPLLALAGRLVGPPRRARWLLAAAVAAGLVLNALQVRYGPLGGDWGVFGRPGPAVRLASLFGTGALLFLFRDDIPPTGRRAVLAGALLVAAMTSPLFAEAGVAILGGCVLAWFAVQGRSPRRAPVAGGGPGRRRRVDLSYGLYLYAWPVQHLLLQADRTLQPWPLFGLTLVGTGALAWLSWTLVEAPCLAWGAAHAAGGGSVGPEIVTPRSVTRPLPSA